MLEKLQIVLVLSACTSTSSEVLIVHIYCLDKHVIGLQVSTKTAFSGEIAIYR